MAVRSASRQCRRPANGEDVNYKGICPAALGSKDEQPAAYSPKTELFYVPTNHVCMDYEPFKVSYTAGQPYVGATLSMYPPPGDTNMGNFIAWDAKTGKIVWSDPGAVLGLVGRSGDRRRRRVLRHARRLSQGGRRQDRQGALQVQDAVGHHRQRHAPTSTTASSTSAMLSGVGGWAGIGLAAGLTEPTDGLGAVGGYAALSNYTALGGTLTVFALPID